MPEITIVHYIIICAAVFVAGFVDAIAGGGGLITLPAYLITGLPSHYVLGTNKLGSAMGTVVSTAEYIKDGFVNWKSGIFCILFTFAGAFIGSNLALLIPDRIFKIIMIVLLPVIAIYVFTHKKIENTNTPFSPRKTLILCILCSFFVGIYDGFYGPGTGTFLILLLTGLCRLTLNQTAGTTKIINLTSDLTSLAVFVWNGKIIWTLGLIAGIFSIAGNYIGAKTFVKNGTKIARPIVIIVLSALFVKILVEWLIGK